MITVRGCGKGPGMKISTAATAATTRKMRTSKNISRTGCAWLFGLAVAGCAGSMGLVSVKARLGRENWTAGTFYPPRGNFQTDRMIDFKQARGSVAAGAVPHRTVCYVD